MEGGPWGGAEFWGWIWRAGNVLEGGNGGELRPLHEENECGPQNEGDAGRSHIFFLYQLGVGCPQPSGLHHPAETRESPGPAKMSLRDHVPGTRASNCLLGVSGSRETGVQGEDMLWAAPPSSHDKVFSLLEEPPLWCQLQSWTHCKVSFGELVENRWRWFQSAIRLPGASLFPPFSCEKPDSPFCKCRFVSICRSNYGMAPASVDPVWEKKGTPQEFEKVDPNHLMSGRHW